jgi:outer membrane protein insertion porin family
MKSFRWIFVALLAFLFVSNVVAQKPQRLVENLDIQGNRRLRDDDLLKLIKTRPGDVFDEKQVQEDLQSLLKTEQFYSTHTKVLTEEAIRGGVNVIFQIRELPLIAELKFVGLNHTKLEEILVELRSQNATIEAEKIYNGAKVLKARRIIREYLVKRGFQNAKVEFIEEIISATTIKLTFAINELPNP